MKTKVIFELSISGFNGRANIFLFLSLSPLLIVISKHIPFALGVFANKTLPTLSFFHIIIFIRNAPRKIPSLKVAAKQKTQNPTPKFNTTNFYDLNVWRALVLLPVRLRLLSSLVAMCGCHKFAANPSVRPFSFVPSAPSACPFHPFHH